MPIKIGLVPNSLLKAPQRFYEDVLIWSSQDPAFSHKPNSTEINAYQSIPLCTLQQTCLPVDQRSQISPLRQIWTRLPF